MNKYTKAVLAVVALLVLSQPIKAAEKVFYCQMTGNTEVSTEGEVKYKLDKFKFKVTADEIIFGSGGFFDDTKMTIDKFANFNFFTARGDWDIVGFADGVFTYGGLAMGELVTAISARCDDF